MQQAQRIVYIPVGIALKPAQVSPKLVTSDTSQQYSIHSINSTNHRVKNIAITIRDEYKANSKAIIDTVTALLSINKPSTSKPKKGTKPNVK